MPIGDQLDPLSPFTFIIEIDGVARAGFAECSGLSIGPEPTHYRNDSNHSDQSKCSGMWNSSHVTLKRCLMHDSYLREWYMDLIQRHCERRSLSIVMLDEAHEEVVRFHLSAAWISKWEPAQLTASTNEFAVESIDLYYDGLEIVSNEQREQREKR